MNKSERLLIHRFIIGVLLSIPLIISANTIWLMYNSNKTGEPWPRQQYEIVANGVITRMYYVGTQGYAVVGGKAIQVQENVMGSYSVGDSVELKIRGGDNGWDITRIILLFFVGIVACFASIFVIVNGIESYFKWVKYGSK